MTSSDKMFIIISYFFFWFSKHTMESQSAKSTGRFCLFPSRPGGEFQSNPRDYPVNQETWYHCWLLKMIYRQVINRTAKSIRQFLFSLWTCNINCKISKESKDKKCVTQIILMSVAYKKTTIINLSVGADRSLYISFRFYRMYQKRLNLLKFKLSSSWCINLTGSQGGRGNNYYLPSRGANLFCS